MATNYHIDPDLGSSEGDGTFEDPFESWADLPSMSTSDCVYFKCGTTFEPSAYLNISWSGTESNPAVIGAYYSDGGSPAAAVYGVSGARPIIDGNNYTVPNKTSGGLIQWTAQDYITVQDLHIYEAGGQGIRIIGATDLSADSTYFVIDNVKVEGAYQSGIQVYRSSSNYGIIQDCEAVSYTHLTLPTN